MRRLLFVVLVLSTSLPPVLAQSDEKTKADVAVVPEKDTNDNKAKKWNSLLPKKDLDGWQITDFGTDGEVERTKSGLRIKMGDPLNGITYQGKDFPKENFEIIVEVQRTKGNDFFCGLTFPVGDEFCSFIAGGWGGGVCGISSVDGADASENDTTCYQEFESNHWYQVRVRVTKTAIAVWIDNEQYFELPRKHHSFSTRIEVFACEPLGYCSYMTECEIRRFDWRKIDGK